MQFLYILKIFCIALFIKALTADVSSQTADPLPFGNNGKFKMLYDVRMKPQAICLKNTVYIVYNGAANVQQEIKNIKEIRGKDKFREPRSLGIKASPMLISYNRLNNSFSEPIQLGPAHHDHHFSPIIWADENNHLHVLFGCHRGSGTYLKSKLPASTDIKKINWKKMPKISESISYPSVYNLSDNRELIYYRIEGHIGSWSYKITSDNGLTWQHPDTPLVDLDVNGKFEWSSYHTTALSHERDILQIGYFEYDDNRDREPKRFLNPRYQEPDFNQWKYNLFYLKLDLNTGNVFNDKKRRLKTPIDFNISKSHCEIMNTDFRGAGVPPAMNVDKNNQPAFLHILSEESMKEHKYYYIRQENGKWIKSPICYSNHQWNSGYLKKDDQGILYAYVITDEGYLESFGMNKHGGGRVEEWISKDEGFNWKKHRDLTPQKGKFKDWRFNNVRPVTRPDSSTVEGLLLFYGWENETSPTAKAFLIDETKR